MAGHRSAPTARRDHAGTTDLQRIGQGPPYAQQPDAGGTGQSGIRGALIENAGMRACLPGSATGRRRESLMPEGAPSSVVTKVSSRSVAETIDRLKGSIEHRGFTLFR